ncbi:WD40 repeat domain-containing protein [Plantactinospora mayteni]|uniref:WD40 repeat domain-containing protein n=1 Tax=Plantactinospora mayteni TaxID=566021 RepID=UPI001943DF4C|nr:hypothetical protein [Plantactinospora mayteni]
MSDERLIWNSRIPSRSPVQDFAVIDVDGRPLVVCADWGNRVWTWDLLADEWVERPLAELGDGLYREFQHVAVEVLNGRTVLATGGPRQNLALWDLFGGQLLSPPPLDRAGVHALAAAQVGGQLTLLAGAGYPDVYSWDPSRVGPAVRAAPRLSGHRDDMSGVAVARLDGRHLVVSGGYDRRLVLSDLESGELIVELWPGGVPRAVKLATVGGRPVVVAASDAGETSDRGEVWIFDPVTAEPVGAALAGHENRILALDVAAIGDRTIAVTGSEDGTARIWDLAAARQLGAPLTGHRDEIFSVVIATVRGRRVALTAGRDGRVRVWDLTP